MPQSLAKILVHTVFSTKDRRPFLRDKPLREELHRYLGGILTDLDCQPIIIGGVEDHVHFLSTLSRTCQAAEMVKEVKRGSSLWLKTKSPDLQISRGKTDTAFSPLAFHRSKRFGTTLRGQEEHHRKVSFQDEFREFLNATMLNLTSGMFGIDATLSGLMNFLTYTQRSRCAATLGWMIQSLSGL